MASNGEVVIIVAGEDQSGTVMQAVEQNLARVQARAAQADRAITQVGGHAVPAMAAASASVRVLDGDFSHLLRAEERFLSTLPGAQSLMQAAFPFIGILAVTEGLYRMGSAVTEFMQKLISMPQTIQRVWGQANLEVQKTNDTLRVSNDRLEMSIAKLEKKPANGLKLALDEARVSADNLALSLIKDNDRMTELLQKNGVSRGGGLLSGQASTADVDDLQKRYSEASNRIAIAGQEKERQAKSAEEAQAARTKTQNDLYALQSRALSEITGKLQGIDQYQSRGAQDTQSFGGFLRSLGHTNFDQSARKASLQGLYGSIAEQQDSVQLTSSSEDLEKEQKAAQFRHDQLEAQRQAAREAAEERRKEEEFVTRMQKLGVGSSREAGYTRAAQDAKLLQESNREVANGADDAIEAIGKSWEKDAEEAVKSSKVQIEALRELQQGRIRAAGEDYHSADQDTQFGVRTGQINESQRFAALRNAAAQEYEIKRNALEQIKALDSINPDDPQKVQRDLDEIADLQKQYSRQMVTLTQQQVEQQRSVTEGYIKSIIDPLISGTDTVSQRFKKMADNIMGELERVAESKAADALTDALMGGKGAKGGPMGSIAGAPSPGGIGASVMGLLGGLFGRKGGSGTSSNGGLATSAGTIADATVSGLQQGKGAPGGNGGVVVNVINQGTPQTAASSGSSGGNGFEQQVISIILKDADSLGPISKGIGGAIQMIG